MGPTNVALVKLFQADQELRAAQETYDHAARSVRVLERKVTDLTTKLQTIQHTLKEQQSRAGNMELDLKMRDERIEKLRAQQEFFYRCDDCAAQVGQQLGVDLVMTPWVQKVSELILNFNVQIFDVPAARVIFSKSVDMRGNEDESWRRAVRYLVRDMAEKRAVNPRYGQ